MEQRHIWKHRNYRDGDPPSLEEDLDYAIIFDPEGEKQNMNIAQNREIGKIIMGSMVDRGNAACLSKKIEFEVMEGSHTKPEARKIFFIGGDITDGADRALIKAGHKLRDVMTAKGT